jgi:hypothetical protein
MKHLIIKENNLTFKNNSDRKIPNLAQTFSTKSQIYMLNFGPYERGFSTSVVILP